jgi:ankyrin repeat protein
MESNEEGKDRLAILWGWVCEAVEGCYERQLEEGTRRGRENKLATKLVGILSNRGINLVLGLDQFEEILDELALFQEDQDKLLGWWPVMHFLRQILKHSQVQLVATLESSRWHTFEKLSIEQILGAQREVFDADVQVNDLAKIARQGFERSGLRLEKKLIEEIKTHWESFELGKIDSNNSSSPLPLACLWLSRLYDRFEDKAALKTSSELQSKMASATDDTASTIQLYELGDEGVSFQSVIEKLGDEAWVAAGETPIHEGNVSDADIQSTLSNFLMSLVALDSDGHIRLLSVSSKALDDTTNRLRKAFANSRLLVPVHSPENDGQETQKRLRLVHQSVINHWPPAAKWFDNRRDYLIIEDSIRLDTKRWIRDGKKSKRPSKQIIQHASQVLNANQAEWPLPDHDLPEEDFDTRAFAISVFNYAQDPFEVIQSSIYKKTFIHLASMYGLTQLISKFVSKKPACVHAKENRGSFPLHDAAWSDTGAVEWLLKNGVLEIPDNVGWLPIVSSIQAFAHQNYELLVKTYEDINQPVGPNEMTMLHIAAHFGNNYVIDDLFCRGADANIKDEYRQTPIYFSAATGHTQEFLKLLPKVDITELDVWGFNPITRAAYNGQNSIIRAFIDSEWISDQQLATVLKQRSKEGLTPIMVACARAHPDNVKLLLEHCDPHCNNHQKDSGDTLLHLAVSGDLLDRHTEEDKIRVRRVVEVLLNDGRLDPNTKNNAGQTAFDCAGKFGDARRVLRADDRVPSDYEHLTEKMRIEDLTSRKTSVTLKLIRSAPQALNDKHDGETGLEILLRTQNNDVLTYVLDEQLCSSEVLQANADKLVKLAVSTSGCLRQAICRLSFLLEKNEEYLPQLLDAALHYDDSETLKVAAEQNINRLVGCEKMRSSFFHSLAQRGHLVRFSELATRQRWQLPIDAWQRKPSDVAASHVKQEIKQIEESAFDPPNVKDLIIESLEDTKFHRLARKGDLKAFEKRALCVSAPVPTNKLGQKPSDVADGALKSKFRQLEKHCFIQES